MRLRLLLVGILAVAGITAAQTPITPDLHLRGDRFKPLSYSELNPEQKTLIEHLLGGERGTTTGPFNVLLRSPEMGDLAQHLGTYIRFHTTVPIKLNEFAILITARALNVQYEWAAHRKAALKEGLSPAIIQAVALGKRPASMQPDETIVYNFASELVRTHQVTDPVFHAAVDKFGEKMVVDLMATIGYYHFVSFFLNVDRYPLPDGDKPELKPLR
ncbi:MAG TPA: carboxymuconolactone decarboxylase family protein [Candidatus Acidoferrales bacterium]|jgi:4-carboxymuconolactone decarboxylase|nr:carboxymuconolactone decarboxylase family protein [Candidatus Acidoferrales bacterium]